ncbi:MAG: toxin-antitoxin system YwqK family antitoxin [Bacteroidales bacterium]
MRIILKLVSFIFFTCSLHSSPDVYAQDVNKLNSDGKKTGKWIVKYENGRTKYEGTFEDGRPVGEMKKYYRSGIMSAKLVYSPNSDSTSAELFDNAARPLASGTYLGTRKVGQWQYFHNGTLSYKQDYRNDSKDGKRYVYFDDGSVFEISTWSNSVLSGEYKTFFAKNGGMASEALYINGSLNNEAKTYHKNGNIESKGIYKNGKQEGNWEYFNEQGKHIYTLTYTDGIMQANSTYDSIQTKEINSLIKQINNKRPDPENFIKDPFQYLEKTNK